ncbi:SMI1/KNR4 family protein [Hymenobacter convexus]|uniref:SMI1/KNR4 family protein n=1 Tax=Hymenobacter sp. CA1UV-4 TaxID=3063782 RepID=UPI00271325F9|nr:SMI1/KNR4 family protein [Hymenobacter sp. CA1UV-4]MDO7850075.1 SMI1/KNR4 family protein [Hymenobacter sp. CA1UV-4]
MDRCLQWMMKHHLNSVPMPVHPAMADSQPCPCANEGYENWLPIASIVTNQQLDDLEATINYPLPADYRRFLQHKHFYALLLGGAEFFPHPIDEWQQVLRQEMLTNWPDALRAGYIPFANYGGAGDVLCFYAEPNQSTADYPVVFYDHEDSRAQPFSRNFATLLPQLLAEIPTRDM